MIELTTPFNPGDVEPGKTYTHMRAASFGMDARQARVRVSMDYIYDEAGTWTTGKGPGPELQIVRNDFHTVKKLKVKKASGDIFREFLKACEQAAIDLGHVAGEVVDVDDPILDDPVELPRQAVHPGKSPRPGDMQIDEDGNITPAT